MAAACSEPHFGARLGGTEARTQLTATQHSVVVVGGEPKLFFNGSARVKTDLRGELVAVVGVDAEPVTACVGVLPAGPEACLRVAPNEEWAVHHAGGKLVCSRARAVPFTAPF